MKRTLFLTLVLSFCSLGLRAQYPQVTSEANARWAAKAQYEDKSQIKIQGDAISDSTKNHAGIL